MLTLQELKAEAKRQGYKLIKDKNPRFERCLCGHNAHQWVSGPKGWAVYCKHCGLNSPWAAKNKTAVIEAWNEMIRARRRGNTGMDYNVIADNFRYRKNELGYSYETLAEMTGMSKSTLQRYATGNIKNIPLHRLDTLCQALQMHPMDFLGIP